MTALKFPPAQLIGSDPSDESLSAGKMNAEAVGGRNLELRRESLNTVKHEGAFDYVQSPITWHGSARTVRIEAWSGLRRKTPSPIGEESTYRSGRGVQTNGTASKQLYDTLDRDLAIGDNMRRLGLDTSSASAIQIRLLLATSA